MSNDRDDTERRVDAAAGKKRARVPLAARPPATHEFATIVIGQAGERVTRGPSRERARDVMLIKYHLERSLSLYATSVNRSFTVSVT